MALAALRGDEQGVIFVQLCNVLARAFDHEARGSNLPEAFEAFATFPAAFFFFLSANVSWEANISFYFRVFLLSFVFLLSSFFFLLSSFFVVSFEEAGRG